MRVAANGIDMHYRIDGPADAPWLMFGNSLATDLSMWDPQAAYFAPHYRVLRYDQRGHGQTEAPQARYSFDILIADAVALMDALGIARTHYCGLSMGGATAMGLAQRHPQRLDHVVICDTPCASSPASAQQWEERIVVAKAQGMAVLADPTLARWFPPETVAAMPPHLKQIRKMIMSTPVYGFIGCAAALADHDFRSAVSTVEMPALFIAGEKDGAVPAAMQQMQRELPASRYVELPGAGHISNLDRPDLFNRAVEDFLRG
jgi:3-oxoadipate enol-lactonase